MGALRILRCLLATNAERYLAELVHDAGLPSGTVRSALTVLEREGVVASRWEDADPRREGRPRRRYFRLTEAGAIRARQFIAEASAAMALPEGA